MDHAISTSCSLHGATFCFVKGSLRGQLCEELSLEGCCTDVLLLALCQVCGSVQIPVPRAQYTVDSQQQQVELGQGPLHLHVAELNACVHL